MVVRWVFVVFIFCGDVWFCFCFGGVRVGECVSLWCGIGCYGVWVYVVVYLCLGLW